MPTQLHNCCFASEPAGTRTSHLDRCCRRRTDMAQVPILLPSPRPGPPGPVTSHLPPPVPPPPTPARGLVVVRGEALRRPGEWCGRSGRRSPRTNRLSFPMDPVREVSWCSVLRRYHFDTVVRKTMLETHICCCSILFFSQVPFTLVEGGGTWPRSDIVHVKLDGVTHPLPLTTVYHQHLPVHALQSSFFQALFGNGLLYWMKKRFLLSERRSLPLEFVNCKMECLKSNFPIKFLVSCLT